MKLDSYICGLISKVDKWQCHPLLKGGWKINRFVK